MQYVFCGLCILLGYPMLMMGSSYRLAPRSSFVDDTIPKTNLLLCYFDDSEITLSGPFTQSLLGALYEGECPLLVSASLIRSIVSYRYYIKTYKSSIDTVRTAVVKNPDLSEEDILYNILNKNRYDVGAATLLYSWNPDAWVWYEVVPDALYLAVPAVMISAKDRDATKDLSYAEALIGLRIDHLAEVKDIKHRLLPKHDLSEQDILDFLKRSQQWLDAGSYLVNPIIQNSIFVSNALYRTAGQLDHRPQWFFIIGGHGSLHQVIAGCSIHTMRTIFAYCDAIILTRGIILNTCYATGTNIALLMQGYQTNLAAKTYSFPLITLSMPDTSSGLALIVNAGFKKDLSSGVIPDITSNYKDLIAMLNGSNFPEYSDILKRFNEGIFDYYMGMPFLYPAGRTDTIPLFTMIDLSKIFVDNQKKPLVAKDRIPKNSIGYTNYIIISLKVVDVPFALDISGLAQEVIIISQVYSSSAPIIHRIDSLKSDHSLLETLSRVRFQRPTGRYYHVQSIACEHDGVVSQEYRDLIVGQWGIYAYKSFNGLLMPVVFQKKFDHTRDMMIWNEGSLFSEHQRDEFQSLISIIKPRYTPLDVVGNEALLLCARQLMLLALVAAS